MHNDLNESSIFIVGEPDKQDGLSVAIERGTIPKEFLNRYQANHDVRCAFCSGHTPHKKGFTVKLEDGRIALCGSVCAKEFFGEDVVSRHARDLETQIKKESQRKILGRTVQGAPETLAILDAQWISLEEIYFQAVNAILDCIDGKCLKDGLAGGHLWLNKRRKASDNDISDQVQGATCLTNLDRRLAKAKGGLVSLKKWGEQTSRIKEEDVESLMVKRKKTVELLKGGVYFIQDAHRFFELSNMSKFRQWLERVPYSTRPSVTLSVDRQLTISDPKDLDKPTVLTLPVKLPKRKSLIGPIEARR